MPDRGAAPDPGIFGQGRMTLNPATEALAASLPDGVLRPVEDRYVDEPRGR